MLLFFQNNVSKSTRIDLLVFELLKNLGKSVSRNDVQKLIKSGNVNVNGIICTKSSEKICGDVDVSVEFEEFDDIQEVNLSPIDLNINVLYDDQDIAVINKPAGISVHYGAGVKSEYTLVNGLKFLFGENLSTLDENRPGIVHRLDKDTSGLMIIAKNNISHNYFISAFKNHEVIKKYIAFAWGVPVMQEFTIDTFIGRSKKNRQKMAVVDNELDGKRAISHFKVLKNYSNIASKIECSIETGRTHQIRVHLAYNKTPVIGDQLYTRSRVISGEQEFFNSFKRQALHSCYLCFYHPKTSEFMEFSQKIPEDMQKLEEILMHVK